MSFKKNITSLAIVFSAGSMLLACGGGGGGAGSTIGGGSPQPPTPTPAPVSFSPINGGNFAEIAAHAVSTGDKFLDFNLGSNSDRPDNILHRTSFVARSAAEGVRLIPSTRIDVSRNCDLGGSMRVTGQLVKAGTLDTGSTLSIVADRCLDRKNVTRNGKLDMTFTANNGKTAAVQYTNFTASEGNSNITLNGDAVLDFAFGNQLARGTSLRVTETIAGKLFFDRTVSDYSLLANSNLFTRSSTNASLTANLLLTTPELGSFRLTIRTIKPFLSTSSDGLVEIDDGTSSIVLTEVGRGSVKVDFHARSGGPVTQSTTSNYFLLTNK
jgi:hypothetical protein